MFEISNNQKKKSKKQPELKHSLTNKKKIGQNLTPPGKSNENWQKLKIPSNLLKTKYHKTFSAVTVALKTANINLM